MSVAQKGILNGWKEIAGYVARDIRTVERWEKQRGLPVRRVPGAGRATVYARISELEEWLASKPLDSETEDADASRATPVPSSLSEPATTAAEGVSAPLPETFPAEERPVTKRLSSAWISVAAIAVFAVAGSALLLRKHVWSSPAPLPPAAPPIFISHSPVPGVDDLYLRGSFLYEQRTPQTLSQALDSFQAAIKLDSDYAPAFAGLANTYNLLREYSVMPDEVAYPKAREAAERAIALDPKLAQAHASLAFGSYYWYMDPAKAEHEFLTAIALDPALAEAHHWYGSVLTHEGRYTEALHELNLAQHLEPSSSAILTSRAFAIGLAGDERQARNMLEDLLSHDGFAKDPNSSTAHLVLGILCMTPPRDWPMYFKQLHEAAALHGGDKSLSEYLAVTEPAFNRGGETALWQALLAHEEKLHPRADDHTINMAAAEANLDQADKAFADLNRLAAKRDRSMASFSLNPAFSPLHGDPRFEQIRSRLGLPRPWGRSG